MFRNFKANMNMGNGAAMAESACACSGTENKALILAMDTVIAVSIFVVAELISLLANLISILVSLIIAGKKYVRGPKTVLVQ